MVILESPTISKFGSLSLIQFAEYVVGILQIYAPFSLSINTSYNKLWGKVESIKVLRTLDSSMQNGVCKPM